MRPGFYRLRRAAAKADAVLVLQGSRVTYAFVQETLPLLAGAGHRLGGVPGDEPRVVRPVGCRRARSGIPESVAQQAMGITGFSISTMYRWIRSATSVERTPCIPAARATTSEADREERWWSTKPDSTGAGQLAESRPTRRRGEAVAVRGVAAGCLPVGSDRGWRLPRLRH